MQTGRPRRRRPRADPGPRSAMLEERYGDQHEVTLLCDNAYGADLRSRGQLGEALELDLSLLPKFERVFGAESRTHAERPQQHRRRLPAARAASARRWRSTSSTFERPAPHPGSRRPAHPDLAWTWWPSTCADLGRYQESLDIARKVVAAFAAVGRPGESRLAQRPDRLRRRAAQGRPSLGRAAVRARRSSSVTATTSAWTTRTRCGPPPTSSTTGGRWVSSPSPRTWAWRSCDRSRRWLLPSRSVRRDGQPGSVLRAAGRPGGGPPLTCRPGTRWSTPTGTSIPFTLAANINYASDLAACGELAEAIRIGQDTLANCRSTLGPDHPDTLMAAVNLAIDVEASGSRGTGGAAPRRRAAPVRGDADHRNIPRPGRLRLRNRLTAEIEPY